MMFKNIQELYQDSPKGMRGTFISKKEKDKNFNLLNQLTSKTPNI